MTRLLTRRWLICSGMILVLGGVLLLPSARWRIVGWVRGERFYEGRPTSFWREDGKDVAEFERSIARSLLSRPPRAPPSPWWQEWRDRLHQCLPSDQTWVLLLKADETALPVLLELADDPDADVRKGCACSLRDMGK